MFIFLVQLTTSRTGNLTRSIHTLLYVMTIHIYLVYCCTGKGAKTKLHQEYPHRKKTIPPFSRKLVFFCKSEHPKNLDKINAVITAALSGRAKALTLQGRHERFIGDSAFHTSLRGALLVVGDRKVSPSTTRIEFDAT